MVLGANGGQKVDEEAEHVPRVHERNNPFEYRGDVPFVVLLGDTEDDAKADLGDNESEFNPEGNTQDGVLAVVNTQALVLPADEDSADDVPNNEDSQTDVMHPVVVVVVEDGQEDEANRADNCSNDTEPRV